MAILKTKLSKIPIKNDVKINVTDNVNIDKIIIISLLKSSRFSDNNNIKKDDYRFNINFADVYNDSTSIDVEVVDKFGRIETELKFNVKELFPVFVANTLKFKPKTKNTINITTLIINFFFQLPHPINV